MPEFLNKWRTSIIEFWARLEKGQKIRFVTGSVLGVALLITFIIFVTRPDYAILYENLSRTDVGKIVVELKAQNIPYKLQGTTVFVPKDKVDGIQADLVYKNVVSDAAKIPEMSPPSILETESDKQNRIKQFTESKIINGLKAIDGISDASLLLNLPEKSNFVLNPDADKPSAGVIITMESGAPPLDKKQVFGIVRFVAKSSGLTPEQVTVLDETGNELNNIGDSTSGYVSTQLELQDTVKAEIQKSVLKFLEAPFGSSNVKVLAAVKLNFNDEVQETKVFEPVNTETQAGIVRSANEIKKELANGANGGVPGTTSNTGTPTYVEGTANADKYVETANTLNYEINETNKKIVKEKGNIQQLSMSIILNKANLPQGANEAELKANTILLVGYALKGYMTDKPYTDAQLKDLVSISVLPFDSSVAKAQIAKDAEAKKQVLIKLITTIVAVALSVIVFGLALFFFLRGRASRSEDGYALEGGSGETISVTGSDGKVYNIPKRPDINVPEIDSDDHNELRKQLEKFVSSKPDAVAQLLKSWISDD